MPDPAPADAFGVVGRVVVRTNCVGLFFPLPGTPGCPALAPGVYEIKNVFGELTMRRVGDSSIPEPRLSGLSLDDVVDLRTSAVTPAELKRLVKEGR